MNAHTGEVEVPILGEKYTLRFDWDALAAIETTHGENPNLFSPDTVASVAAFGFRKKHPELTAERIKELSPPLMPFAQAVQQALQWAYFGLEALPEDSAASKKKTRGKGGWFKRLLRRLFRMG